MYSPGSHYSLGDRGFVLRSNGSPVETSTGNLLSHSKNNSKDYKPLSVSVAKIGEFWAGMGTGNNVCKRGSGGASNGVLVAG